MDKLLDDLEAQFSELVSRISHLEKLDDQPTKLADLDVRLVKEVTYIQKQLEAGIELQNLQEESQQLDKQVNEILIELAQCRQELEKYDPTCDNKGKVNPDDLLDYATKITKFTKKMPGTEATILPWPAEDQLRRGMLATLTIQSEQNEETEKPTDEMEVEKVEVKPTKRTRRNVKPRQKISLDFDSDDD